MNGIKCLGQQINYSHRVGTRYVQVVVAHRCEMARGSRTKSGGQSKKSSAPVYVCLDQLLILGPS